MSNFNRTNAQSKIVENAVVSSRNIAEILIASARQAHDAIVKLPHLNENGDGGQYGANREMTHIRDHLMVSFMGLHYLIGVDYIDLLRYKHKFAGTSFRSDEEWAKDYSHLNDEIVRLQQRVDDGTDIR